jgi:PAS domain-containing protein
MEQIERNIQDRLGAVLHTLATVEQRSSAVGSDDRSMQTLMKLFRQLAADLETGFARLREASAQHAELRRNLEAATRRASLLFQNSPVPCVIVDEIGMIVDANGAAASLLNTSAKYLPKKAFEVFLAEDRAGFLTWLDRVSRGAQSERWTGMLRPREQRPTRIEVAGAPDAPGRIALVVTAAPARLDSATRVPQTVSISDLAV